MAKEKKQKGKMDMQAMMKIYQKVGTPSAPHKRLASLTGSWITKTKAWMEPDKPPVESTGTCKQKMLLDGRYLQQEYSGKMMGSMFKGINVIGYDNHTKKYVSTWVDSMSTASIFLKGPPARMARPLPRKAATTTPSGVPSTWRSVSRTVNAGP